MYAQEDVDDWIKDQFPSDFKGFACELGACDGVSISNTLLLEENGWKVLCIEANPDYADALRVNRKTVMICACDSEPSAVTTFYVNPSNPEAYSALRPEVMDQATMATRRVMVRTLDQCLKLAGFSVLDVLSVDTEGTELDVLKGLSLNRWMPGVIVAESWHADTPITPYLEQYGYTLIERRGVNNLYRRAHEAARPIALSGDVQGSAS